MDARTPNQLHPLWIDAHNSGDLDAVMALCEANVCFVTWSGGSVSGAEAAREAYALDASPDHRRVLALPPSSREAGRCPRALKTARATWR